MNYGINHLWPTTVLLDKMENTELVNQVSQEILLNYNAYSLPTDFGDFNIIDQGGPVLEQFRDQIVIPYFEKFIRQAFNLELSDYKFALKSWLASPKNGYFITVHNHAGATASGVFYLMCEEKDRGGELILVDPRTNANRGYINEFKLPFENKVISPSTGDALLFPSFVYHYTNFFSGNLRLAMPVDLFIKQ